MEKKRFGDNGMMAKHQINGNTYIATIADSKDKWNDKNIVVRANPRTGEDHGLAPRPFMLDSHYDIIVNRSNRLDDDTPLDEHISNAIHDAVQEVEESIEEEQKEQNALEYSFEAAKEFHENE